MLSARFWPITARPMSPTSACCIAFIPSPLVSCRWWGQPIRSRRSLRPRDDLDRISGRVDAASGLVDQRYATPVAHHVGRMVVVRAEETEAPVGLPHPSAVDLVRVG